MKLIIFSDTHLTDKFEDHKFLFLRKLISASDRVIINGDFWDRSQIVFDQFLSSKWRGLFPLLRKREAVYVYGNHDRKDWSDERTSLFSTKQVDKLKLSHGKLKIHVEHGHEIIPNFFDKNSWLPPIRIIDSIDSFAFCLGLKMNETRTFNLLKRKNQLIKKRSHNKFGKSEILICSHTHAPEIDLKLNFINSGFIMFGKASYVEIESQNITLKNTSY